MTDPSLVNQKQTTLAPAELWTVSDDYDDDDEADYDDFDDDDASASVSPVRWLSRPGFASPEWWSRT